MLSPDNNKIPVGLKIFWEKDQPIPDGWALVCEVKSAGRVQIVSGGKSLIMIEKIDNLMFIERLAKERGLV